MAVGQKCAMGRIGIGVDSKENIGPVGGAHDAGDVTGRPTIGGLAAGGQDQHLVAHVEVGQAVGHQDHHPARVGELSQPRHDLAVQRWVQP